MSQLVTLSRAAHLVGVSRAVLQRMVRGGELNAFDGLIPLEDLLRRFPDARIENSGAFEKIARIKEEAFGRRVRERTLPSQEILAQRLFVQSQELADLRRHLERYHALVASTLSRLAELEAAHPAIRDLRLAVDEDLAGVLGSTSADSMEAITAMLKIVSANVSVRPSGREFLVEGNDSLLQAGLKAGLRFNYGCGGGTCGLCKARVVSGEVQPLQATDYRLSAAEQQQGYVLLCTHTALTDVVIETLEAQGPADIPRQELVATTRALTPLGQDTLLLHLQTPRTNRLRFLAGQSVTLGVATTGDDAEATLPLASCPCDDRNLHFHVARDAGDPFSVRLFGGGVRPGDPVNVRGPVGNFVLEAETGRPLLFLACDTGFGPIKSLIEHAIAADATESFTLLWLATRDDGHYLDKQCRAWAAAFDHFRYEAHRADDTAQGAADMCRRALAGRSLADADVFVAGPAQFVAATGAALAASNAAPERIYTAVA